MRNLVASGFSRKDVAVAAFGLKAEATGSRNDYSPTMRISATDQ